MISFGARRGRVILYTVGLLFAIVLDRFTPLGIADWLVQALLVLAASVWGSTTIEMQIVALAGSVSVLLGLWTSPNPYMPIWMEVTNRILYVVALWIVLYVAGRRAAAELEAKKAAAHIKILHGLLPICAFCKSIRTEHGDWNKLEAYLSSHSEVRLTHTYCPTCLKKHFPDLAGNVIPS